MQYPSAGGLGSIVRRTRSPPRWNVHSSHALRYFCSDLAGIGPSNKAKTDYEHVTPWGVSQAMAMARYFSPLSIACIIPEVSFRLGNPSMLPRAIATAENAVQPRVVNENASGGFLDDYATFDVRTRAK